MLPWMQRVGKRLNLIVMLMCSLAILGIGVATFQRIDAERRHAIAAALVSNRNLAMAFSHQVSSTLKAAEQVAAFVREQYLQQGAGIDLRRWVEEGVLRETMFTIISVVNEAGDIVSSSQPAAMANYADREFFKAQRESDRDELFISPPVVGRVSGAARLPMSLRITRPDGSFGGVVVLSVEPDHLVDFYDKAELTDTRLLELTGLDGIVRGRRLGPHSSHGDSARELTWFKNRTSAATGGFVDDGSALDDVVRIVSYRTMADYPLMVTVGTDYVEELAPVMKRRSDYLTVAGATAAALLLFSGLFIWLLAHRNKAAEALLASEAQYRATFYQAAAGIAHVAPDGRILAANEKFHDTLGFDADALIGRNLFELSDPEHRWAIQQFLMRCLLTQHGAGSEIEKPYRRRDGSLVWLAGAFGVVRTPNGRPSYVVAVMQDITARKQLEARLSHDAMHDALTDLPNRVLFQDRLARTLESAKRHGTLVAVLYIDLDGFKAVNDRHGHAAGDVLLQQAAQRLAACTRAEDTVARFGGDEFGVILTTISAEQDCRLVAKKIADALSAPYEIDSVHARISASVGAAIFPTHGSDSDTLVAHADAAMYCAKRARRASNALQLTY